VKDVSHEKGQDESICKKRIEKTPGLFKGKKRRSVRSREDEEVQKMECACKEASGGKSDEKRNRRTMSFLD